jgi:hypothetical protein
MRHFGDSAQPYSTGAEHLATDGQFAAHPAKGEKSANLAQLIHDQFSPANQYDLSHNQYGGGEKARRALGQRSESVLPPISFKPEEVSAPQQAVFKPQTYGADQVTTSVHPLLAHLRKSEGNHNEVVANDKTAGKISDDLRSALTRQHDYSYTDSIKNDAAFNAPNCYQTMQINPQEGWTKTITTLSDLSSSKIEMRGKEGSSITYTDKLGRPVSESQFDKSGKLLSETTAMFENQSNPAIPSRKIIKTDGQTIELTLDARGAVISRNATPYSDLQQHA